MTSSVRRITVLCNWMYAEFNSLLDEYIDLSTVSRCVYRVTSALLEENRDVFEINNNVVRRGFYEKIFAQLT